MAEVKAVNISQLSLPQLDQVKTQLDEDVALLTNSMQQLKAVQQALKESKESLADIVPENDGKTILVPLTSSMYVPGKMMHGEKVLVDIGTGYYVDKTVEEAGKFFQRRMDHVTKNLETLQKGLMEKCKMREGVVGVMQMKLQAVAARPQ